MTMARRAQRRGGGGWWLMLVLVAIALAAWWMHTRRAEAPAPPASVPGARSLGEAPAAPDARQGGAHEEITPPEKAELERVLRERGGAPAR